MTKKIILWAMLMTTCMTAAFSQVGIGINTPAPTSMLDVTSTEKGFLPPRMSTAQRDAISVPAAGLIIYNLDVHCLQFWNTMKWVSKCEIEPGEVFSLDCAGAMHQGTLNLGIPASGVSSVISYTGGNGGSHSGQTVNSTGVNGLTATLAMGSFTNGAGTLTYTITGTPSGSGTASFAINIGRQTCTLTRTVVPEQNLFTSKAPTYNGNSVIDSRGVGYYNFPIPSTSTIVLEVDIKVLGPYNLTGTITIDKDNQTTNVPISPQTLTYSASGTFTSLGVQNITFTHNAVTPQWFGANNITISGTGINNTKIIRPRIDIISLDNTAVVTVANNWMDRNLGAHRKAVVPSDPLAMGHLYQWGRGSDGHQTIVTDGEMWFDRKGLYGTTTTQSNTDNPGHNLFILEGDTVYGNWRSPDNRDLWRGVSGSNNPCPSGYRIPTTIDWYNVSVNLGLETMSQAFNSTLKMVSTSSRDNVTGNISWSSWMRYWAHAYEAWNVDWTDTTSEYIIDDQPGLQEFYFQNSVPRAKGYPVRCVQ